MSDQKILPQSDKAASISSNHFKADQPVTLIMGPLWKFQPMQMTEPEKSCNETCFNSVLYVAWASQVIQ